MTNIFNNEIQTALKVAHNLSEAGEKKLAEEIYVGCVKDVAKHNNKDVLTYFYGSKVYNELKSAMDAVRYVFIAQCAKEAYCAIENLGAANDIDKAWATVSAEKSDEKLCEAFVWLSGKNRLVEDDDHKHFKALADIAKNKGKIEFKMTDKVKKLKLTDIISGIVGGIRTVSEGELK